MLAVELAQYLDILGLGTYDAVGTTGNIFIDGYPDNPNTMIAIRNTGGTQSSSFQPYDLPTIQILTRAIKTTDAYDLAKNIYDALIGLHNITLVENGTYIHNCESMQSAPVSLGKDANNRQEYSMNFAFDVSNETVNRHW